MPAKHKEPGKQRAWNSWRSIKSRCLNPADGDYGLYGGRGITVRSKWFSFNGFFDDMGERPEGMSLDRINNDGNYEPGNCRWATQEQQCNNKSYHRKLTKDGVTLTIAQWAKRLGVKEARIYNRIYRGMPEEKVLDDFGADFRWMRADGGVTQEAANLWDDHMSGATRQSICSKYGLSYAAFYWVLRKVGKLTESAQSIGQNVLSG